MGDGADPATRVEALGGTRDDLVVAGAAAGATVALSVVLAFGLNLPVPPLPRMSPLAVYLCYLLFGTGDTGSRVEEPLPWAVAAGLVAAGTLVYYVV